MTSLRASRFPFSARIRDLALVTGVSLGARLAFLAWKDPAAICYDLRAWSAVARRLAAGENPYVSTDFLNWPPLWMQLIFGLDRIAKALGISTVLAIQLFLIAAEVGVIVATHDLLFAVGCSRGKRRWILLIGIALNPICILLVCQHGNFDVLVGFLVVLFLSAMIRWKRGGPIEDWFLACFWLGLGTTLKVVPIVLAPLLLVGIRRLSRAARFLGAAVVLGPAAYGVSVLYVMNPAEIARKVIGYRSLPWRFGFTRLLRVFHLEHWIGGYRVLFVGALLACMALVGTYVLRRAAVPDRSLICGALLLLAFIPFAGPGYGPQYIYWFWPLVLAAFATGTRNVREMTILFSATAAATYVFEYAFRATLGGFLLGHFSPTHPLVLFTTVRLPTLRWPLFLSYALLVGALLLSFTVEDRDAEVASPGVPIRR